MDDILDTSPDITPELVQSYLTNTQYPITLDDIIKEAYRQRAPQNILSVLQGLPPGLYRSYNEFEYNLRKALQ